MHSPGFPCRPRLIATGLNGLSSPLAAEVETWPCPVLLALLVPPLRHLLVRLYRFHWNLVQVGFQAHCVSYHWLSTYPLLFTSGHPLRPFPLLQPTGDPDMPKIIQRCNIPKMVLSYVAEELRCLYKYYSRPSTAYVTLIT